MSSDDEPFISKAGNTFTSKETLTNTPAIHWELYKDGSFTDFCLVTRNKAYQVHRVILVALCTFLYPVLTHNRSVSCLGVDIDDQVMPYLLEYIYLGQVEFPLELATVLGDAAKRLGVKRLAEDCQRVMLSQCVPSLANCLSGWVSAINLNDPDLIQKFQSMALGQFKHLVDDTSFETLDLESVKRYLCNPSLSVESPDERLSAAITWVSADSNNRIHQLPTLLSDLDLDKMNKTFVKFIADRDPVVSVHKASRAILLSAAAASVKPASMVSTSATNVFPSSSTSPSPSVSKAPSQSAAPSSSPSPSVSKAPSQSAAPSSSPALSATKAPSQSAAPSSSQALSASKAPSSSPSPSASKAPSQSAAPSSSPALSATKAPSQSAAPSSSPALSATKAPSQSAAPSSSPALSATKAPSQSAAPSSSPALSATKATSQSAAPSSSPALSVTKAPLQSAASSPSAAVPRQSSCTATVWLGSSILSIYPAAWTSSVHKVDTPTGQLHERVACCGLGESIYIAGAGQDRRSIMKYDVIQKSWQTCGQLRHARERSCMCVSDSSLLVMAGCKPGPFSTLVRDVEVVDSTTHRVSDAGRLRGVSCYSACCCVCDGGDVAVLGPYDDRGRGLLQLYGVETRAPAACIKLPSGFSGHPMGIVHVNGQLVFIDYTGSIYTTPVSAVRQQEETLQHRIYRYTSPNKYAVLTQHDSLLILVGGSNVTHQVYTADVMEVLANQGGGWSPVCVEFEKRRWCSPGAVCTLSLPADTQ